MNCPVCDSPLDEIQDISVRISFSGSEGGEDELEERDEDRSTRWHCSECGFVEQREAK